MATCLACCWSNHATAETPDAKTRLAESPIAESSDLSAALPAGQWSQIESSVDRALVWLASQQNADGSFPGIPNAQPAITSLGVMAFLSRGHMPEHGRYGKQLTKAIDYVLATQNRRGIFCLLRVAPGGDHLSTAQTAIYNHCIAGLMLGEVYGMTSAGQSARIRKAIERGLIVSRSVQTRPKKSPEEQGGWRYIEPEGGDSSDLSVTGWALMFLRSARNAEFDVPLAHVEEGLNFVEHCFASDPVDQDRGVFRYRAESAKDGKVTLANTGSGMLSLLLGGRHEHASIRVGVDWFCSRSYPKATSNEEGRFYLATYYSSQAMAQVGGETWNQIYPQIARNLLEVQTNSGAWPSGRSGESSFGPGYTTSLAVLSLTPPYQLLPIYQR